MARLKALTETDDSPVEDARGREHRVFECPSCGFPICEWCDCPECGWMNDEIWEVTAGYHGLDD